MLNRSKILVLITVLVLTMSAAAQWKYLGPDGGDARSLTFDPRNPDRILLGTSAGQLFESHDGGRSWTPTMHFGQRDDYVLDNIAFDSKNPNLVYLAAWSIEETNGDLFRSDDGGRTWKANPGMKGKSIRAFAIAESDSNILTVGALDGVFRSNDGGQTWKKITPDGHPDLRNFESLAVDPKDANIIYAGTWHLPWKTSDGGKTWQNIKNGVIDDSDVFSIIIDRSNSAVVYASACSGIYRSENAGNLFHKIQGIPGSARRTRILQQDPVNPQVVYAGTTEGLWKTNDGGKTFHLTSPPNFILNDVMVDPRNSSRVLIATDRGGVFASDNAAQTFVASNRGFSHRQITGIVSDIKNPETLYVGLVNDKEFGGVFQSRDSGQSWSQISDGLARRDVFDLKQATNGMLVAATNRGLFRLAHGSREWQPINTVVTIREQPTPKPRRANGKLVQPVALPPVVEKTNFDRRVLAIDVSGESWFATTDFGILRSTDAGKTWINNPIPQETTFVDVSQSGTRVVAVAPRAVAISTDAGLHWSRKPLPIYVTRVFNVTLKGEAIWLATREGAVRSDDGGNTWEHVNNGLPPRNIVSIQRGASGVLVATTDSNTVFTSRDSGASWQQSARAIYNIRRATAAEDAVWGATAYNGLVRADLNTVTVRAKGRE